MRTATCTCGRKPRHGQRNCHRCHATAQRGYRKRLLHFARIGRAVEARERQRKSG